MSDLDATPTRPITYSEIELLIYLSTVYAGANAWDDELDVDDWSLVEASMRSAVAPLRAAWNLPEHGPTWPTQADVEGWRFRRSRGPSPEAQRVEALWDSIDVLLGWSDGVQHFPLDWVADELIDIGAGVAPLLQVPAHVPALRLEAP